MNMKPLRSLVSIGLLLACCTVQANTPVRLVTAEEAALPEPRSPSTRAITRGPGIRLVSPTDVSAAGFTLRVQFERRGGTRVDPQSLRLDYLKEPVVDLTDRVRTHFNGELLEVPLATVPAGEHHFRLRVRDVEGRDAASQFTLRAR